MFSWEADKARKNYEKHDVPFEEASELSATPKPSTGKMSRTQNENRAVSDSVRPLKAGFS
jgi:uncharacterized DUF497 family protein